MNMKNIVFYIIVVAIGATLTILVLNNSHKENVEREKQYIHATAIVAKKRTATHVAFVHYAREQQSIRATVTQNDCLENKRSFHYCETELAKEQLQKFSAGTLYRGCFKCQWEDALNSMSKHIYSLKSLDGTFNHLMNCAYVDDKEYFMVYTKKQKEQIAECKHVGFNRPAPVISFVSTEEERQQASEHFTTQRTQMLIRAERYLTSAIHFCQRIEYVYSELDKFVEFWSKEYKSGIKDFERTISRYSHIRNACEWHLKPHIEKLVEWYPQNFYRLARIRYSTFEYFMEKYPNLAQQIIRLYPSIKKLINCELEPKEGIRHNYRVYCLDTNG